MWGLGEGRQDITLIQSPQRPVTLQYWSTVLVFVNHSCPGKGPKLVRWGRYKQELGASPASSTTPPLASAAPGPGGDRQTDTHANAHTLSESGSSISPPSALLNPIVQTRGRAPRGLDLLPVPHHPIIAHPHRVGRLGQSLRPSGPFLSPLVYGLLQAQLVTLFGGQRKGSGENSPRDPSCHLPKLGRNCRYSRTTPSSKISVKGQAQGLSPNSPHSSADPFYVAGPSNPPLMLWPTLLSGGP